MTNYPRDEFDNIPEVSSRQGVHRTAVVAARTSWWPIIIVFAAVVLVAAVLASIFLPRLMGGQPMTATPDAHSSAAAAPPNSDQSGKKPAPGGQTQSGGAAESHSQEPEPDVDKSQPVGVYSASRQAGVETRASGQVTDAGFTVAQVGAWAGNPVSASVVYYQGEAAKAPAVEIAQQLGINDVVPATATPFPIIVVLGPQAQ